MKKLNLKKINISVNTVLQELAEMQFEITDPADIDIFVNEIAEKTGTIYHFVNDLILEHMTEFPRSFIKNWEVYITEEYGLLGPFSEKTAKEELELVLKDLFKYRSEFVPEEYKLPKKELVEETISVPYASFLNKYTPDEIWNIASGKKTDVSEEEIEQAKDVIQRGIISSKLSMKKEAQEIDYVLKAFEELDFELIDPDDVEVFIDGLVHESGASRDELNKLIVNNMQRFPQAFIDNWKIYFVENYGLKEPFSKEEATNILNILLIGSYRGEKSVEEEKLTLKRGPLSKTPYIKELEKFTPEILRKYTEDEIWNIASGKKTDVTSEEIEQAKDVISRGIIANKLSMRKEAQDSEAPFGSIEYYDYVERRLNRLEEISAKKGLTEKQMKEYERLVSEKESMEKMQRNKRHSIVDKLNIEKFAQSTPETIQKAQQGDKDAIAKVIEENESLVASVLIKWGYTPGSDEFQDTLSDIKVEILNRVIPQYDSSKGAFSTFLTTAVYNFLRRGTRKKEYEEKQKEVSTEEPTGEDITLGETLEDKSHPIVQMTINSARENLQSYVHTKNPELEDLILRIFDLKIEDNTHEQIAEVLNEEGFKVKGKPITRFIVNNLVNEWIKPALEQYFEAFKTAKLGMRKEAQNITIEDVLGIYNLQNKPEDAEEFVMETSLDLEIEVYSINKLIFQNMSKFPNYFIEDWKNYVVILHGLKDSSSEKDMEEFFEYKLNMRKTVQETDILDVLPLYEITPKGYQLYERAVEEEWYNKPEDLQNTSFVEGQITLFMEVLANFAEESFAESIKYPIIDLKNVIHKLLSGEYIKPYKRSKASKKEASTKSKLLGEISRAKTKEDIENVRKKMNKALDFGQINEDEAATMEYVMNQKLKRILEE